MTCSFPVYTRLAGMPVKNMVRLIAVSISLYNIYLQ